jgi:hypothetical protein
MVSPPKPKAKVDFEIDSLRFRANVTDFGESIPSRRRGHPDTWTPDESTGVEYTIVMLCRIDGKDREFDLDGIVQEEIRRIHGDMIEDMIEEYGYNIYID